MSDADPTRPRALYGRRKGHALRPAQVARMGTLAALAPSARTFATPCWLEIGFGGGEHLVHQAVTHPDGHIVGAEPYINGVAMLLGRIEAAGVANLSVHPGDVRDLFDVMPDGCIGRAFLLYPDPWPKVRHHRRRFVTAQYLAPLARVMAAGADLRIASDIADYLRQARDEVPRHGFALTDDAATPWDGWTGTRYEAKALREGRVPRYLTFQRRVA